MAARSCSRRTGRGWRASAGPLRCSPAPIWAEHQAAHASAVAELRAVGPLLNVRWRDVVPPATPVVPGDEDRDLRPQASLDDRLDLACGPLAALGDVAGAGGALWRP